MAFIREEDFRRNISPDDLRCLNNLLTSNSLDLGDKKNAFLIASFLVDTKCSDDKEMSILENFTKFCLNEQISRRVSFSSLLTNIVLKITKTMEDKNSEEIDLLKRKILTMISAGVNNLDMEDLEYNDIMIKVLNSDISSQDYDFIRVLFERHDLKFNLEKRMIIFKQVLSMQIKSSILRENSCVYIWDILEDENVLSFDNDSYRKVVDMVITGEEINAWVLSTAVKNAKLSLSKRAILIDYYRQIMAKYIQNYSFDEVRRLLEQSEGNIFNVAYSSNLISLDDEEYAKVLQEILNSDKAFSYVKVLASTVINEEQRKIALDLINQGKFGEGKTRIKIDYKDPVAMAANSLVLVKCSINEYTKILTQINNWCEKLEELHASEKIDWRILYGSVSKGAIRLLNCPEIYGEDLSRFYVTMDVLLSAEASEYLINELVNFSCSKMSTYYNDIEYVRALELIKRLYRKKLYSEVTKLFINANIPFMEDKSLLFDVAQNGDKQAIEELTHKLNNEGYYNMNVASIFNGVDEETINSVIGPTILRVRQLNKKNNHKI